MGGKYVAYANDTTYSCIPRGNLKLNKLFVGDIVRIEKDEYSNHFVIESVEDRVNTLLRPPLSNVNQIVVVLAPTPKPDYLLIDKLIINATMLNIGIILVVNKSDIDTIYKEVYDQYHLCVDEILEISAKKNLGIDKLKEILKEKFSVFVGQSAVGKSTILNCLNPEIFAKTGELSVKIDRGKNTTRHSEIYVFDGIMIADTPGFSLYDLEIEHDEIKYYYPEFKNNCKYLSCNHINERANECSVIQDVEKGLINKDRYDRYKQLFLEIKSKWDKKYR